MPPEPVIRDIPGYYFCPERKKYFKIETSHTAPADSFYSAANVKKRTLEQEQAARSRKRRDATKGHIKRATILSDPMTGGRLLHEAGAHDPELPNKCWLTGLQDKGEVLIKDQGFHGTSSINCMLVNGDDTQSGMAVIYAAAAVPHPANLLLGCYVPTDRDGFINFSADPLNRRSRKHKIRAEPFIFTDITSVTYHRGSHKILQTSKVPGSDRARITMFTPLLSSNCTVAHDFTNEPAPHPAWLLGEAQGLLSITLPRPHLELRHSRTQPDAHGETNFHALIATNRGPLKIVGSDFAWMGPRNPEPHHHYPDSPYDCLSVDWHPTNPNMVYAGGRNGKFFHRDMRGPDRGNGWNWYRHRSSVAHIRGLDDFQILTAGPRSAMAIYDIRRLVPGRRKEAAPVCTMHDYINEAHIDIGLDVAKLHGGESVVAAASSSGTVQVFSLRTGDKLRAGALDNLSTPGSVSKCLQWETMPGEKDPSLWVSVGTSVKKYSFGLDEREDVLL